MQYRLHCIGLVFQKLRGKVGDNFWTSCSQRIEAMIQGNSMSWTLRFMIIYGGGGIKLRGLDQQHFS